MDIRNSEVQKVLKISHAYPLELVTAECRSSDRSRLFNLSNVVYVYRMRLLQHIVQSLNNFSAQERR